MKKTAALGELLIRLTPEKKQRFVQADKMELYFGGSEANAAVSLASFGIPSLFVSRLPEHMIGEAGVRFLRMNGVETAHILRGGDRVGLYFMEEGAGIRNAATIYDRAHSSFSESVPGEYDWDEILKDCDWLHVSGITPALGENCARLTEEALETARKNGITTSFDLNYRSLLWKPEEARAVMDRILPLVDILIANDRDVYGMYDFSYQTDASDIDARAHEIADLMTERYGFKSTAIITVADGAGGGKKLYGSLLKDGAYYDSPHYPAQIISAVGAGDAFSAAVIAAAKLDFAEADQIRFATAAAALKYSIPGDVNLVSKEEVVRFMQKAGSGWIDR